MPKLTQQTYIERVSKLHDHFYIYEKTIFTKADEKIIITCPNHGDFTMSAGQHLHKCQECPKCVKDRGNIEIKISLCIQCNLNKSTNRNKKCQNCTQIKNKLTLERFIKEGNIIHNNFYGYDKVIIEHSRSKVVITCPNHGDFILRADEHIYKNRIQECPKCVKDRRKLTNKKREKKKINPIRICKECNKEKLVNDKNFCEECVKSRRSRKQNENNRNRYKQKNREYIKVESKICIKCNTEKSIDNFPTKIDSKDGTRNECTECYIFSNRERKRKYKQKNREVLREKDKIYRRERSERDFLYKAKLIARDVIRKALSNANYTKKSHTYEILGCSYEEFKIHIENQFTDGMTWINRSLWHIDHIVPLSFGESEEEILMLNYYSNLRPLWAVDNLLKSGNITDNTDLYYKILENRKRLK